MQEVSHREYLTWLEEFKRRWNNPSRSDYYLMAIAAEVARVLATKPKLIQPEQFKMQFSFKSVPRLQVQETEGMTKKQIAAQMATISKQFWMHAVNYNKYQQPQNSE